MDKIIVAVGSTRRPKVEAVREAMDVLRPTFHTDAQFDLIPMDVPSGVRHTPLSRAEIMAGARARVEALRRIAREKGEHWRYFVGLEGGVEIVHEGGARWIFLENWAYVADASGAGSFGESGGIALPEGLAKRVVDEGIELAAAIDEFAGGQAIRDAQGAWGVLTGNLITRRDSYRIAVISAFASILNPVGRRALDAS